MMNAWRSHFVFFVAISLVGALISSILRLTHFEWHRPLTRIAEIIAVAGIIFAGLIIIIDMGRPERILYLFTHGRIQSPIMWDVIVVSTYFVTSALFLYKLNFTFFLLMPGAISINFPTAAELSKAFDNSQGSPFVLWAL